MGVVATGRNRRSASLGQGEPEREPARASPKPPPQATDVLERLVDGAREHGGAYQRFNERVSRPKLAGPAGSDRRRGSGDPWRRRARGVAAVCMERRSGMANPDRGVRHDAL